MCSSDLELLRQSLDARLDAELTRYGAWIDALRAREEEGLVAERAKFTGLRETAARIAEARARLG